MPTWIEPPPKQRKSGCLGKGCMMLVVFLILLAVAFFVGGEDEGMLLYVRRTEFFEPEQAAVDWNAGRLDAVVVPDDEMEDLLPRLRGGEPKKLLTSKPAGRYGKRYFLLVRPPSS